MNELADVLSECDILIKFRTDDCKGILNIFDLYHSDIKGGDFHYIVVYLGIFSDFDLFVDNETGLCIQITLAPNNSKHFKQYELSKDFINKAIALKSVDVSTQSIVESLILPDIKNQEIHEYKEWVNNERHALPK